jgi:hypothetical protein
MRTVSIPWVPEIQTTQPLRSADSPNSASKIRKIGELRAQRVCGRFYQLNDRYGHLEGNRLCAKSRPGLKPDCHEYDYGARMGGDEFVVLTHGDGTASAQPQAWIRDWTTTSVQ